MCQSKILDQAVFIFGSGAGRTVPTGTNRPLGLNGGQARFLRFRVLEQVDMGATITVTVGGTVKALFGGIACDEIVGREFDPVKLDGAGLDSVQIQSSGSLTLQVSAVEG